MKKKEISFDNLIFQWKQITTGNNDCKVIFPGMHRRETVINVYIGVNPLGLQLSFSPVTCVQSDS